MMHWDWFVSQHLYESHRDGENESVPSPLAVQEHMEILTRLKACRRIAPILPRPQALRFKDPGSLMRHSCSASE